MGNYSSKQQHKSVRDTDASSPTISKKQRDEKLVELQSAQRESESPHLLPSTDFLEKINVSSPLLLLSSDSLERIDVPSASGANSDPSASSTSVNGNNYYVFLSFRGPDTRKGFVDHLYQRLKAVGLPFHPNFVFRDDEDLPFGKKIGENLINAIERSKVFIPVISENYAASEWCLRELIHIMKCKESGEQIVLPVLYKVKPKDVGCLRGGFGEAFDSCKDEFEEEVKQQGPLALRKVVDLRVFESEKFADGREGELVNELVEIILREQKYDLQPHLPVNLVAIEDRVADVMELMDLACPNTRIIGIWGMGGIGKTTLATIIYKKLFDKFQYRSSLKDIRETIKMEGIKHVQSLLISDITKSPPHSMHNSDIGIAMIRLSCENKKVLILLDDVDHQEHLNNLIGGCTFGSGSRIIITCRNKALLKSEYKMYELKEMNHTESLLMFSRYAFEEEQPPKDLATLSSDIVATTRGLPLALMVVGSLLKGEKDQVIWEERLEKLRKVPHEDVQEKLKISYDTLSHPEKEMFLDIACFFIGTDKRIATYFWADLKFFPRTGLQILINLSLIKIDGGNRLRMHDQLRDLGRIIACPAEKKPWKWSRLWDEEAMKVLRCKENEKYENIEALRLDESGSNEFMMRKSFKKMPNLKFLHLKAVDFARDFEGSLSELRWLKWERCCDSFKVTSVHLENLVVLELSSQEDIRNRISENWRGWRFFLKRRGWSSIKMEGLKVLNLSSFSKLKSNPNLSAFENLELLILEGCANLKEINPSIQYAKRLLFLNLSYCRSLKMLPEQLGELKNLEEHVIDGTRITEIPQSIGSLKKLKRLSAKCDWPHYSSLKKIPSSIGKLEELVELNLSRARIKELPESIGKLNKLKILKILSSEIESIPSSIGKLQSLQELNASWSKLKGQILIHKGGLSSLKTLDLQFAEISGLPENLDRLSSLKHLNLYCCFHLESLPKPPFSLSSLKLTCRSNELPSLSHLKHLQQLRLWNCVSLQSIPELPSCIQKLDVAQCPKLERLPNLSDLEFLSKLYLVGCDGLRKLDGLEALKSLRALHLWLSSAEKVDHLHAIEGLEKLGSLEEVDISGRKHIQVLDLSKSEHLKELIVMDCKSLVEIRCPSKFLERFERYGCKSLEKLPDLFIEDSEEYADSTEEDYEEYSDSMDDD